MNILVIGLGSMGKRRIRLIREMYPQFCIYGVDGREDRRKEAGEQFGIVCEKKIDSVAQKYSVNAAFICTSPLTHCNLIAECLHHKWHIFTELNLVSDGYESNMALAKKNGCKLFLSSTFFYREEIKFIRSKVTTNQKWNYIYHIGQYLPDWHPWESYKDFFVGDKRTNGCREIMAIELPWIIQTFGNITKVHTVSDKMTALNIDYNDNYMIQITHENGNKGMLIVDVVSPIAVRRFEAYGEGAYLRWEGTPETLYVYNHACDSLEKAVMNEVEEHQEGYRAFVVENAYKNEIKEFFEVVCDEKEPLYSFQQDLIILKLIDQLEANI